MKPFASKTLGYLLEDKDIRVETELMTGEVDPQKKVIRSYDAREVPYDTVNRRRGLSRDRDRPRP